MLFPYKYVPHKMYMMHEFVNFIFYEVWCTAPASEYGLHLFAPHKSLHKIMVELYRRDMAEVLKDGAGKFFYEAVNEIFNEFKQLSDHEIAQYKFFFASNNMIEELCSSTATYTPVVYGDLNPDKDVLNKKLEDFFKKLYSSGFFSLKIVKDVVESELGAYYTDFINENDQNVCPFCGLLPIDTEYDPTREAFDHYLPKSKYPFNSLNLKNLAPSCYKCNSGNKRDYDPLHDKSGTRRKAFYPFCEKIPDISIDINIIKKNWIKLKPEMLSIDLKCATAQEETDTWNELFRIKQRYLAKCCSSSGSKYWFDQIEDECQNYQKTAIEILSHYLEWANKHPWIEANFLRKAFLMGCQRAGFFEL